MLDETTTVTLTLAQAGAIQDAVAPYRDRMPKHDLDALAVLDVRVRSALTRMPHLDSDPAFLDIAERAGLGCAGEGK